MQEGRRRETRYLERKGQGRRHQGEQQQPPAQHPRTHRHGPNPTNPEPAGTPQLQPTTHLHREKILPLVQPSQLSREGGSAPGSSSGGKGRSICTAAIDTHSYPSLNPAHPAMSAAHTIISSSPLPHEHLHSTSIYLWSPHDTSRSARKQGMYLRSSTLRWLKQEEGSPATTRINICLNGKPKSSHWGRNSVLLGTGMESPCSEEHLI